jgi:N-acetyltransferase
MLWEFYPIPACHTPPGFRRFFELALSAGSLLIIDHASGRVIGSTRLYDFDGAKRSLVIGHTFLRRDYWGSGYNAQIKQLLLNYAFVFVDTVIFYMVEGNIRSRKALEKLGAVLAGDIVRNYGEITLSCVVYELKKEKSLFISVDTHFG